MSISPEETKSSGILPDLIENEHTKEEEKANQRLIIFSDGILAFSITLSAIAIRISGDAQVLQSRAHWIITQCIIYVAAFIMVAMSWSEHHSIFLHIKRNNVVLIALNLVYLGSIVALPIGLNLVLTDVQLNNVLSSPGSGSGYSTYLFLGSLLLAAFALVAIWWYAAHADLLAGELDTAFINYMTLRLLSHPLTFLIILLSFIFFPVIVAVIITIVFMVGRWVYFHVHLGRAHKDGDSRKVATTHNIERIQLFSDAVISVAITILAAQIDFPAAGNASEEISKAVNESWPRLHAFMIACVIMAVYWLFHYHLFHFIKRHSTTLVVLNFLFLLCISLMFIPVNLYASYWNQSGSGWAVLFFGLWQILAVFLLYLTWIYVANRKGLLQEKIRQVGTRENKDFRQFGTFTLINLCVFFGITLISLYFHPLRRPLVYILVYLTLLGLAWIVSYILTPRLHLRRGRATLVHSI